MQLNGATDTKIRIYRHFHQQIAFQLGLQFTAIIFFIHAERSKKLSS